MSDLIRYFEEEHGPLPKRWVVCPQCRGRGTSCAYLGAFTHDEMHEMGDEFIDDYASGFYDRTCDVCDGRTTVEEVCEDALTPELLKLWHQHQQGEWEYRSLCEMERRMGA